MMARKTAKGPQFIQYFGPVIDALKELGGSGRPAEVKDIIAERLQISEEEQNELLDSGASRFSNRVDWARFYLAKTGYIDASVRGVWSLTEKGREATINQQKALSIFKQAREDMDLDKTQGTTKEVRASDAAEDLEGAADPDLKDYRSSLLDVLASLSPSGFERLCQRLLRESGFERVNVTGRSGDGGIDGIGVLQMTPFVSFKVLFQCKRYSGSVGPSQVRDFRGAMMGRADKGIIMTTGTFTSEAKREAVRDGVPPIELVDGEKLLDMFESLQLGLKPRTTYDVDHDFFDDFR